MLFRSQRPRLTVRSVTMDVSPLLYSLQTHFTSISPPLGGRPPGRQQLCSTVAERAPEQQPVTHTHQHARTHTHTRRHTHTHTLAHTHTHNHAHTHTQARTQTHPPTKSHACTIQQTSIHLHTRSLSAPSVSLQHQFLSEALQWRAQTDPDHVLYVLLNAKVTPPPTHTHKHTHTVCPHGIHT